MIKAVFFDFWGTLIIIKNKNEVEKMRLERAKKIKQELYNSNYKFTTKQVMDALEKTRTEFDNLRIATNKEWTANEVIKKTIVKLSDKNKQITTKQQLQKKLVKIYSMSLLSMNIALRTGTLHLLEYLKQKNIKVGLISNTEHGTIEITLLKKFNIYKYFSSITLSSELGIRKPFSLLFLHALKSCKVPANKSIHIGDQLYADVEGSKQCGMKAIYIKNNIRGKTEIIEESSIKPDAVVTEFSQIPKILSKL